MTRELMKMVGVSVSSSLCTAVFVVACAASADKRGDDAPGSGDAVAGEDGGGGEDDGGDGPGDDGDDGDDVSAADLAALAAQIDDLVAFQASMLCYLERQRDGQGWEGENTSDPDYPGFWYDIVWDGDGYLHEGEGQSFWTQGANSDAAQAYDDCF